MKSKNSAKTIDLLPITEAMSFLSGSALIWIKNEVRLNIDLLCLIIVFVFSINSFYSIFCVFFCYFFPIKLILFLRANILDILAYICSQPKQPKTLA